MFVLVEMVDTVRTPPWQFERKLNDSIAEELNKKLANKVLGPTGLPGSAGTGEPSAVPSHAASLVLVMPSLGLGQVVYLRTGFPHLYMVMLSYKDGVGMGCGMHSVLCPVLGPWPYVTLPALVPVAIFVCLRLFEQNRD